MKSHWPILILFIVIALVIIHGVISNRAMQRQRDKAFNEFLTKEPADTLWYGWNQYQISLDSDSGRLIRYGHDLIENTAFYLGPKGTVAHISNGMNCQNCHLAAGILPYGSNYGKVYATYPQFRARSNAVQNIYGRVNDCFERSLNGQALDTNSREMQAIYAYMQWLGAGIPKGVAKGGTGIMKLLYLSRAASPAAGRQVYAATCQSCHGKEGEGQPNNDGSGYIYPPLWGNHSYNDGAGLYRISSFAGFVKCNMPFGTTWQNPALTDEEAWDVAAFVNSQPRPHADQSGDWHNITTKPVDFPFGPYNDTFPQQQHKYGPFKAIAMAYKK